MRVPDRPGAASPTDRSAPCDAMPKTTPADELTRHPCSASAAVSFAPALARPPQRRCRVPSRERIHERLESGHNARLVLLDSRTSRPRSPVCRLRRRFAACELAANLLTRPRCKASCGRERRTNRTVTPRRSIPQPPPRGTSLVRSARHNVRSITLTMGSFHPPPPESNRHRRQGRTEYEDCRQRNHRDFSRQ